MKSTVDNLRSSAWARAPLAVTIGLVTSTPAVAQFSTEQETAFGLNAGRLAGDLNLLIAGVIIAILLAGFAAISFAAYGRWATGRMAASVVASLALRASMLLVIASIFLR